MNRIMIGAMAVLILVHCSSEKKEATAQNDDKVLATIAWTLGDVKIQGESEKKAEVGQPLLPTDTVVTGSNSTAEIMVAGSGIIKMAANTEISVASIIQPGENVDTNVKVNYGKIVTLVKKNRKDEDFTVVTPTALAGVRGTSFMTSVEAPGKNGQKVNCAKDDCVVHFAVLEGSIAVKKPGEDNEVILQKNRELILKKGDKLSQKMVLSLNKSSLSDMKDLIVLHKNDVMEYSQLVDELKANNAELEMLSKTQDVDSLKQEFARREANSGVSDEVVKTAKKVDEGKYVQKEVQKDKLKLQPKETF